MTQSGLDNIQEIAPCLWEIPQTYKAGMLVPGRVFTDAAMLEVIRQEQALEQVVNVAMLPGIVGASLAMPDIHWGYGFPVGGVAAMDAEDGVISPGGIGYDINCLPGQSQVLHAHGYHRPIEEFAGAWSEQRIICSDPADGPRETAIVAFLQKQTSAHGLLRLTTATGRHIMATEDHPFLTPAGMVPLGRIDARDRVAVAGFEGVPYEAPRDSLIVDEAAIAAAYPGPKTGLLQVINALRARQLLPLALDNPKLPYLIKLMGLIQGEGSLTFLKRGGSMIAVYGEPHDLETVRKDVESLGFVASRVYQRTRVHRIDTRYGVPEFSSTESCVHCGSTALAVLLRCLGTVAGNKTEQHFGAPQWLHRAPMWMKRLYLAALFGAELTAPQTVTGHPYSFRGPVLSQNKTPAALESGRQYLEDIRNWLAEMGVQSSLLRPSSTDEHVGRNGRVTVRLRLKISSTPENLIGLWSRVGFEYNRGKQHLASVAVQYLRSKRLVLEERDGSVRDAWKLHLAEMPVSTIVATIGSPYVGRRFVERSLWEERKTSVRIASRFSDFPTFLAENTPGLGQTGRVWDWVIRVERVPHCGPVFDFTVADDNHNFIADGFVVSNCGVRLLATDLRAPDVKGRMDKLADKLYSTVPTGVGDKSEIKLGSKAEFDQVLHDGARWAIEAGYGLPEDVERIEEGGSLRGADPATISARARERGMRQVGSLGSGNHFLEIQEVEEIYDPETALAFGLWQRQVVVFIHTGSRGFGHQVCTDSLHDMGAAIKRYGIELPDRQLACAPIHSPEGEKYLAAMACAANFAWANRQCITHWVRQALRSVFSVPREEVSLVYDVSHNIAKLERYQVGGQERDVYVHRKGATRAFPAGHPDLSPSVRPHGQPVLIPGDMGRYSYVAVGTEGALERSFGSICHGAGRLRSRGATKRLLEGVDIRAQLKSKGITVRAQNPKLLAEEASEAYKDVADVVDIVQRAGIARTVARMKPLAVIKG